MRWRAGFRPRVLPSEPSARAPKRKASGGVFSVRARVPAVRGHEVLY